MEDNAMKSNAMDTMPMSYYLEELQANITAGDWIKAQVLFSYIHTLSPQFQHRMLFELSRCAPSFAIPILGYLLTRVTELAVPQASVQSILADKLCADPDTLRLLLESTIHQEKAMGIELAGALRLTTAVPLLLARLRKETHPELLAALITALGAIGDATAVEAITDYLYASTQALVTTAVRALAQIGSPETIQHLAARLGTDDALDHHILDAFARMHHPLALECLSETLRTSHATLRNYAKQHLHRLGAHAVPQLVHNLTDADVDFLVHTLNLLGTIGDEHASSRFASSSIVSRAMPMYALRPMKPWGCCHCKKAPFWLPKA
jgi:hypothetical protein